MANGNFTPVGIYSNFSTPWILSPFLSIFIRFYINNTKQNNKQSFFFLLRSRCPNTAPLPFFSNFYLFVSPYSFKIILLKKKKIFLFSAFWLFNLFCSINEIFITVEFLKIFEILLLFFFYPIPIEKHREKQLKEGKKINQYKFLA